MVLLPETRTLNNLDLNGHLKKKEGKTSKNLEDNLKAIIKLMNTQLLRRLKGKLRWGTTSAVL